MTLAAAPTRPDFWSHGACVDLPAEWFHPDRGESTKEAKAVCRSCPVRTDCLGYALTTLQKFGIWGGTSERERRRIRRRLNRGEPVPELDPAPDDDHADPDPIIIIPEEEPVDLTIAEPATPTPNGTAAVAGTATCAQCGKPFAKKRRDQRFHSQECARRWYAAHPASTRAKAGPRPVGSPPRAAPTPLAALGGAARDVDLQSLLGQLLAGCDRWHIEADVGDIHLTITRAVP